MAPKFIIPFNLTICLLLVTSVAGQWDEYEAVWKAKPGMMHVNMDAQSSPYRDRLIYMIEITTEAKECDDSGYPVSSEGDQINVKLLIMDSLIASDRYSLSVGRLHYQCEVKEYIYVEDTTGITKKLRTVTDSEYKVRLLADSEWKIYQDFIYPDEYLMQTMANKKIIKILQIEGYDLHSKKLLTHFSSFASEEDRKKYRRFILEQNFEVQSEDIDHTNALPYHIDFTRKDKLQLEQISNITLRLHQKSEYLNGKYGGWEIEIE